MRHYLKGLFFTAPCRDQLQFDDSYSLKWNRWLTAEQGRVSPTFGAVRLIDLTSTVAGSTESCPQSSTVTLTGILITSANFGETAQCQTD